MEERSYSLPWLREMRYRSPEHVLDVADYVWRCRNEFVRWPQCRLLFWPGVVRKKGICSYPDELRTLARDARISLDRRSNGPAIVAFHLAGGERPQKVGNRHGWSVHHIYDGLHPAPRRSSSSHAVKHGDLFTEAAGLVALHPVADALASEVPFFAWCLRFEAFLRFQFDPDGVFDTDAMAGDTPLSEDFHMSDTPAASYHSTRLHFKAAIIEPLADNDVFEIHTPDATWRMTKAQFYSSFPNVVASESYAGARREYFYTKPPRKADRFLVAAPN